MVKLLLVRHGESTANAANVFTGWNDVPLTARGLMQAREAGALIKTVKNFQPTHIHTSVLSRAIVTANTIAEVCGWLYLPLTKSWRLNERNYGNLRGNNKDQLRQIYGTTLVEKWRRDFLTVPPKGKQVKDRRYQGIPAASVPQAESLAQAQQRLWPYYVTEVASRLLRGEDQLIVAHGSSLRVLIKALDGIEGQDCGKILVPNAEPIVYEFNKEMVITDKKILSQNI